MLVLALNVKEGDAVVDIIFQDDEDLVLLLKRMVWVLSLKQILLLLLVECNGC